MVGSYFLIYSILKHYFSEDIRNSLVIYFSHKKFQNIPLSRVNISYHCIYFLNHMSSLFSRKEKGILWINVFKIKTVFHDLWLLMFLTLHYSLQGISFVFHLHSCISLSPVCFCRWHHTRILPLSDFMQNRRWMD